MAIVRCAATVSSIVMKWKYINAATMQAAINDAFGEKAVLMARTAIARMFETCALDAGAVRVVVFIFGSHFLMKRIILMFSVGRNTEKVPLPVDFHLEQGSGRINAPHGTELVL